MTDVGVLIPESWRERKKRATRGALRRSAVRLVADRGLAGVTVEEIATMAGVSARTFFNYFPSKEDAVTGFDPAVLAEMVDRLLGRPAGESASLALRATLSQVLSSPDRDHEELLGWLQVIHSDKQLVAHHALRWGDTERELVAALAKRRNTDPARDRYASLVVATMLAASRVALLSWCAEEGRRPLSEVLTVHLDVLGDGLAEPSRGMR